MKLRIRRVSPLLGNPLPEPHYATTGAAGLDLVACLEESLLLAPGTRHKVPTGIAIELPSPDYAAFVFPRSGLATRHGIDLANAVGVIDSDYRGEILVALRNTGDEPFPIEPGDRIAQLVIVPVVQVSLDWAEELNDTKRGSGGFGHTG